MKRLYYLTDSIQCAENVSDHLHQQGITDWNFHIMSRDKKGLKQHQLHSTNRVLHELDVIRSAERGAIIGIFISFFLLANLIFLTEFELSVTLLAPLIKVRYISLVLFLIICLSTGALGALVGGLIGTLFENARLARFHKALAAGKYLLMIDVKKSDVGLIRLLMERYSQAVCVGEDSTFVDPLEVPA